MLTFFFHRELLSLTLAVRLHQASNSNSSTRLRDHLVVSNTVHRLSSKAMDSLLVAHRSLLPRRTLANTLGS
jgi:hypothetical protein